MKDNMKKIFFYLLCAGTTIISFHTLPAMEDQNEFDTLLRSMQEQTYEGRIPLPTSSPESSSKEKNTRKESKKKKILSKICKRMSKIAQEDTDTIKVIDTLNTINASFLFTFDCVNNEITPHVDDWLTRYNEQYAQMPPEKFLKCVVRESKNKQSILEKDQSAQPITQNTEAHSKPQLHPQRKKELQETLRKVRKAKKNQELLILPIDQGAVSAFKDLLHSVFEKMGIQHGKVTIKEKKSISMHYCYPENQLKTNAQDLYHITQMHLGPDDIEVTPSKE